MWELVHSRSEVEGRPETVFQLCSRYGQPIKFLWWFSVTMDVLDSVHDDVKLQLCVCISAVWRQRPACYEPCACSSETELLWDP